MNINLILIFIIIVVIIVFIIWLKKYNAEKLRKRLLDKYGDPVVVNNIIARKIWEGQTREMLLDSLGSPLDIDEKVFKSKTKQTWKYRKIGANRYGLRVTLENDVVVGWDIKD